MGLLYCIKILTTLLLSVLGFSPDAKADVRDHLGSTRAVIDETGELLQTVNYYASGVPFTLTQGETATDRLHSGKQFIDHQGLGYYDNSARMLDVLGSRFTTLDPMATDYGHLSPYTYCAGNPLKYTDPDGKKVIATSLTAQRMILNTLSPRDRQAVQFNNIGQINTEILNKHTSLSNNFANLVELDNAKENIFVEMSTGLVQYADNEGNLKTQEMYYWGVEEDFKDMLFELVSGNTTGETGRLGVTLLPGKGESGVNSPNENIYIIVNGHLSELGAAETYCHEANGHALIYIRTGDRNASRHQFENGLDINTDLVKMIRDSREEAVKNFNMQP